MPCGDPNCKYCDQRTFKCFHCSPPYALEGEKCVSSCNPFYNLQDTDSGFLCHDPYEGNVGFAPVLWVLMFLAGIYVLVSFRKHRNKYLVPSAFLALFSVLEFMCRFGLLVNLYKSPLLSVYLNGFTFISIFGNTTIAYIFKRLYLSLYQESFKAFFIFSNYNRRFYKVASFLALVSGPMFNEIYHTRLLKLPQNNFQKIKPYKNSLYRMQVASLILSALQFFVYFYTLIKYSYVQNEAFFLSITGILINITIFVCYKLRRKIEHAHKEQLNINMDD